MIEDFQVARMAAHADRKQAKDWLRAMEVQASVAEAEPSNDAAQFLRDFGRGF